MPWYVVSIITVCCFWVVSVVLSQIDEDYVIYWAVGLLYPILKVILYPAIAINRYNNEREYYEKNGITKLQYVFGKRVYKKRNR